MRPESRIDELEAAAVQAEKSGDVSSLLSLDVYPATGLSIYTLDDARFADRMNSLMQRYNMSVLMRKEHLYECYLYALSKRMYESLLGIYYSKGRQAETALLAMERVLSELDGQHVIQDYRLQKAVTVELKAGDFSASAGSSISTAATQDTSYDTFANVSGEVALCGIKAGTSIESSAIRGNSLSYSTEL